MANDASSAGLSSASSPTQVALPFNGVVAVVIGNWLEFYDFLVFTFFAVMIGDAFFPAESQFGRLLGALATFGVGFVTRPLGAAIIGPYADRVGRSCRADAHTADDGGRVGDGRTDTAVRPDWNRSADPPGGRTSDSGLFVRR
jgi:hypothetical protein